MRKFQIIICLVFAPFLVFSQEVDSTFLKLDDYLEMVKKYHPVVRQARLITEQGESNLLRARGAFDPKVEAGYDRKDFKDTEYFDIFNATFKIPTWYGIELKAKFENNQGVFLNPQNTVPDNGLLAAGISIPVGQGLFINERMAALKQAKIFRDQSEAEQQLAVNEILFDASTAYFDWFTSYNELKIYQNFIENAERRYQGILKSHEAGDKPAIDTLEANIQIQDRKLSLEQARLDLYKASLKLATFLWTDNNTPLEIREDVYPEASFFEEMKDYLRSLDEDLIVSHPKIQSLGYKIEMLEYERRLKANKLLPELNLEYNYLSGDPEVLNSFVNDNYKFGFSFSVPLFLRKERGDLQLTRLKLENAEFELVNSELELRNKILALERQFSSYLDQLQLVEDLVQSYTRMLSAEERKLELGESSVFLVNTREKNLISAKLKEISLKQKLLNTRADLYRVLARFEI
ncbi:TolC family protein [Christiangramia sabulilitoris]|uniref:TolC family protein n=1 Tax=Christiangramia sabulilitoris TaxID=2583991 RepID=A0A550I9A6_9FLAO|nr:TolC family protein [Christiangramia sabulilitoris]TRO67516.1 TolC family protein [Christiangramia sabulilitoris]